MTRILVAVTDHRTAATFLPDIVKALKPRCAHLVVVSSPGEGLTQLALDQEVDTRPLEMLRDISPVHDLFTLFSAIQLLRRFRPETVMVATPKASLIFGLASRILHVDRLIVMSWGLRHESLSGAKRGLVRCSEALTLRLAHNIVPNSRSLAERIVDDGLASPSKITVLGDGSSHGVNLTRFRPHPFRDKDAVVVGFVGRIREDKGVRELLAAFDEISNDEMALELKLIGPLEDERLATELQRGKGFGRIQHIPYSSDIVSEYEEIDILCLPTWREGFPNVCLEAAACGIPVITTDATGAFDAVVDGVTGIRVPARNTLQLARALRMLAADAPLRRTMGMHGRSWVEDRFESNQVCGRLADFATSAAGSS